MVKNPGPAAGEDGYWRCLRARDAQGRPGKIGWPADPLPTASRQTTTTPAATERPTETGCQDVGVRRARLTRAEKIYLDHWCHGVELQLERFTADGNSNRVLEASFLIVAAFQVRRSVAMLERHAAEGVAGLVGIFDAKHPYLRSLRNALEHHDEFLRGQGKSAAGQVWFPLGTRKDGRAHILLIPPLDGGAAAAINLDVLAADTVNLAATARQVMSRTVASWDLKPDPRRPA